MIKMNNWNPDSSYRVSEIELGNHEAVIFDLKQAEIIKRISLTIAHRDCGRFALISGCSVSIMNTLLY